jgi:hypothetical protein
MPNMFGKVFDTTGSVYGVNSGPSYYSSGLEGTNSKTIGAALSSNPDPSAPANAVTVLPGLDGTLLGQPVTMWMILGGAAVLIYWLMHHHSGGSIEKDLATPRIGLGAFWSIGIQAVLFIFLFKALLSKYRIPGLTELLASV